MMFDSCKSKESSRPTRRFGVEWTKPLRVDALDVPGGEPDGHQRSVRGPRPRRQPGTEAPTAIASARFTFGDGLGWFGSMRFRYFEPRPLIEDNSVRSQPPALLNGGVGYNFENGINLSLDVLNLANAKADQITYFYTSRLPGEGADGVADRHSIPSSREPYA